MGRDQNAIAAGVFCARILSFGTHNISFAHGDADISFLRLLDVYDEVFPLLRAGALDGRMGELAASRLSHCSRFAETCCAHSFSY